MSWLMMAAMFPLTIILYLIIFGLSWLKIKAIKGDKKMTDIEGDQRMSDI